jgi:dihydrolipoamide dehydrogenase
MVKAKTKTKTEKWDVVVIGAGPAGYVAAIRCAQRGLKTLCIDEWIDHAGDSSLGGTCLNVGCIPSKALLESSHLYQLAKSEFDQHGIAVSSLDINVEAMLARKDKVVSDLTQGIRTLFKANGVSEIHGRAKITALDTVVISDRKAMKKIKKVKAKNIIIATGSSPIRLQQAKIQDDYILDSAAALELDKVPERLGIVGAGAIGLELGSVWSRLGSEVVLLEAMNDFLPLTDRKLSNIAKRSLMKQGLDIRLNSRMIEARVKDKKVHVIYEDKNGEHKEVFDKLVIAVGRKPNSDRLFGEELGIEIDERHSIMVNNRCQTSVPHIYAIGDVVRGPMLAHKGSEEGIMVAESIAGNHHVEVDYDLVPYVIYTHPEIAWVGKTEEECKTAGIKINVGSFPFAASGRARAMAEPEGQVKIIADAETDRVLGVHIYSAQASELIAQAVLMMEMQATSEDIALTMFAHPTMSEAMHEAALSVHGQAIHIKD